MNIRSGILCVRMDRYIIPDSCRFLIEPHISVIVFRDRSHSPEFVVEEVHH